MELLVGFLSGLIGAAVGFVTAKYFITKSSQIDKTLQKQRLEQEKTVEAALTSIAHSKKLAQEIGRQSAALQSQLQGYEADLIQLKGLRNQDSLPFFSSQATEFLRTRKQTTQEQAVDLDFRPPDYSEVSTTIMEKAANGDRDVNKKS